jgi:hypothetical protein
MAGGISAIYGEFQWSTKPGSIFRAWTKKYGGTRSKTTGNFLLK